MTGKHHDLKLVAEVKQLVPSLGYAEVARRLHLPYQTVKHSFLRTFRADSISRTHVHLWSREAAYLSGFFDGEGTIGLAVTWTRRPQFSVCLSFGNKHIPTLQWIASLLPASVQHSAHGVFTARVYPPYVWPLALRLSRLSRVRKEDLLLVVELCELQAIRNRYLIHRREVEIAIQLLSRTQRRLRIVKRLECFLAEFPPELEPSFWRNFDNGPR